MSIKLNHILYYTAYYFCVPQVCPLSFFSIHYPLLLSNAQDQSTLHFLILVSCSQYTILHFKAHPLSGVSNITRIYFTIIDPKHYNKTQLVKNNYRTFKRYKD